MLAGGTGLAQAVAIVATPVLSRVYGPTSFGTFGTYAAILGVLSIAAVWKYDSAIPLSKTPREGEGLVALCLVILVGMSALTAVAVVLLRGQVGIWLGGALPSTLLYWLPVGVLATGLFNVLRFWATWREEFPRLSRAKVAQQVVGQFGVGIPLGVAGLGGMGLVMGQIATQAVGSIALLVRGPLLGIGWLRRQSWRHLREIARRHIRFPRYILWGSVVNAIGIQLPVFALSWFSIEGVGFYSLTTRVLAMPASLIGQSVSHVFYPLAARNAEEGALAGYTSALALALFRIGLGIFGVVAAAGPTLFAVVFGDRWHEAGLYASLLTPWFLMALVSSPISTIALVKAQQAFAFYVSLAEVASRALAVGVGILVLQSAVGMVLLVSAAGVGVSLVSVSRMLRFVGASRRRVFGDMVRTGLAWSPVFVALWALGRVIDGAWYAALALAVGVAVVVWHGRRAARLSFGR